MALSRDAYLAQIQALLPPGPALSRAPGSNLTALLGALSGEYARIDVRGDDLLDEADPRTVDELLGEWEAAYGLPDPCLPLNAGLSERRAALVARVTGSFGQSRGYFIGLAASFGVAITITEFTEAAAGTLLAGEPVFGADWATAWRVNAPTIETTWFRAGSNAGLELQSVGSAILECLFARQKPANTFVFFAYS